MILDYGMMQEGRDKERIKRRNIQVRWSEYGSHSGQHWAPDRGFSIILLGVPHLRISASLGSIESRNIMGGLSNDTGCGSRPQGPLVQGTMVTSVAWC